MIYLLQNSIAKHATERPNAAAFRCRDESLNYQDLFERSSQLANTLKNLGLKNLDRVGIYMNKGIEIPISVYGILSAGGAYVPIDPTLPSDRINYMLGDCEIEFLVTTQTKLRQVEKIAEGELSTLRFVIGLPENSISNIQSISWESVENFESIPPKTTTQEDDLAYIMYTSGSTGRPKGLMHTHRSGLAYARYSSSQYEVTPEDILGNHAPLHFDISTFEFLTGPYVGACSVIIPEEELVFPQSLIELIKHERLTFWYSVPLALVQMITRGNLKPGDLPSLQWVLFGGEPISPKYLEKLIQAVPNARFCNVYGPAEVNQCTYYNIPLDFRANETPVPIGSSWAGASLLIVDENDQPVRQNELGELLVSSSTMMQGYWGKPELNRNAFYIENTVSNFQRRFYRTGDLVRKDSQGVIHFSGRKDRQIKIRGYRVELDEIEAVFTAQREVEEAVAVVIDSESDEKQIVVAIIARPLETFDPKKASLIAKEKLPAYGNPNHIVELQTIPRTPTGKPDRIALAAQLPT